jgi:hypothetical protein
LKRCGLLLEGVAQRRFGRLASHSLASAARLTANAGTQVTAVRPT